MRFSILLLTLALGLPSYADTFNQRLTALQGASNVIGAHQEGSLVPLFDGGEGGVTVHRAEVQYWAIDGDTIKPQTKALVVVNQGTQSEAAYWLGGIPEPLRTPPVELYITDRNTPFTAAQVETFANAAWADALSPGFTPRPIRGFSVQAVDGSTVAVSGHFNTAAGTWERQEWYIHLVDANGSVVIGNSNIEFERKGNTVEAAL